MSQRALLVGCGAMANAWARVAAERDDVELVGLVDVHLPAAERLAARFELDCPRFEALVPALRETTPDIVLDVAVPEARRGIVLAALDAGCHVLAEKPMALSAVDADALVDAAERAGRTFAVMQNRRYLPGMRAARELVVGGSIGTPGFVNADFFLGPHFGGFREAMMHPLLVDMAIHTFDQARFLTGADPTAVYCRSFNPEGSWYRGDASAVCVFEMSGGIVFCYRGSWCAEGTPTSWQAEWRVIGSGGTVHWDGGDAPFAEVPAATEGFLRPVERIEPEGRWQGRREHAGCLDEMFDALAAGRAPETDCRDNRQSIAMVHAAIESARSGRRVEIHQPRQGLADREGSDS